MKDDSSPRVGALARTVDWRAIPTRGHKQHQRAFDGLFCDAIEHHAADRAGGCGRRRWGILRPEGETTQAYGQATGEQFQTHAALDTGCVSSDHRQTSDRRAQRQ